MMQPFLKPPLRRISRVGVAVICGVLFSVTCWGINVNQQRLVLPHVVRGSADPAGVTFETIVTITNPGPGGAEITIASSVFDLEVEAEPLRLAPNQTHILHIQGGTFQAGAVSLTSDDVFAASALLLKRRNGSNEILAGAAVFGSPLVSKVSLPVFLNSDFAENTGIALFYNYLGGADLRFTLYDQAGNLVATRTERAPFHPETSPVGSDRAAFFITQLFSDLPSELTQGSLSIEQHSPPFIADGFAVQALYTLGDRFWTAEVSPIDDLRGYSVKLRSVDDVELTAGQLSDTYGFEIRSTVNDAIFIRATLEVARAVSRDARVLEVHPEGFITLSGTQ